MSQPFDLTIDVQSRAVVLRTEHLHASSPWEDVRELIGRLLASSGVDSVAVDRIQATATLRLRKPDDIGVPIVNGSQQLRAVAQALRHPASKTFLLADAYSQLPAVQVRRLPGGITSGTIVCELPGRVRLRHPLLKGNPALVRQVQSELSQIPGIEAVSASSLTGSVLLLYSHGATTPSQLLARLEGLMGGEQEVTGAVLAGPPISHWIAAGGCLGLAVTSEFFVPGAASVTALALVANNLPTLGRGLVELGTFKWRVASLYTVIMGTTLVTGQFLAAAVMQASMTAWHGWTTHRLRKSVRSLEADPQIASPLFDDKLHSASGVSHGRRIIPGSIVHVPIGAVLPFDGIVVGGEGDVNEQRLCGGHRSPTRCRHGDQVFAGSELLTGPLAVKVGAVDSGTRRSMIRRTVHSLICEAVGEGGATPRAKAVASRFVPATFATGSAALLAGDLTTLAAVLRPDFCTGPSLTDRLGTLTGISHLLHEGWLVKNCESLHALAQARIIVLVQVDEPAKHEDDKASQSPGDPASSVASPSVCYRELPGASPPIQLHEVRGSLADCVEYVQSLRGIQKHIAVVAGQPALRRLATDDVVRVSLTPDLCLDQPYADIVALHSAPHRVEDLLRVVHESFRPGQNAWSVILTCNALAISGAFLAGLTSLHVCFLTNVGALAAGVLYNRHVKRSDALLTSHSVHTATSSPDMFPVATQDRLPPSAIQEPSHSRPIAAASGLPPPAVTKSGKRSPRGNRRNVAEFRSDSADVSDGVVILDQQVVTN